MSSHSRLRLGRAALALLAFGVLALLTVMLKQVVQPRGHSVAEAEARARMARAKVGAAVRVTDAADKIGRQAGLTNSAVHEAIQAVGESVIRKFNEENASAEVDLGLARRLAAADHCVQKYDDLESAQDALVRLTLGGIDGAVLRPPNSSKDTGSRQVYEVMVPSADGSNAVVALRETRVAEVTTLTEPLQVMKACRALKERQIRMALRPKKESEEADKPVRSYFVYVRPDDLESAKAALAGLSGASQP